MKPTEHELWQDETAARLRSRDRQREPHRGLPPLREGPRRGDRASVRLQCLACLGPIFVESDSNGESVTCINAACGTAFETYQVDGRVTLEVLTLDLSPDGDAP